MTLYILSDERTFFVLISGSDQRLEMIFENKFLTKHIASFIFVYIKIPILFGFTSHLSVVN